MRQKEQMELGLKVGQGRVCAPPERVDWWFAQMRKVVDQAEGEDFTENAGFQEEAASFDHAMN